MKLSSKSAVITFIAGLGLLIPAAIGLGHLDAPTILCPLPALTVLPLFRFSDWHVWKPVKVAMAVPMLLFFVWQPGLFRGEVKIPKRSYVLLTVVILLSVIWFVGGWKYGMEYQGAQDTYAFAIVNLVWASILALAFISDRKRQHSFAVNFILHWLLFAWLAWYAFPYLGELP